jgi:predicted DNA-binding transcriptional regulator AlpA
MVQLLTTEDVARRLAISRRALFALRASEVDFPRAIRLGARTIRFRESDLAAWVAARLGEIDKG